MNLNSLNIIDYAVVAVYLASMVVIGFLVTRFSKTDQDYFKGGNRIPWAMSSLSLFIGSFTAYMFVGASGQAYNVGPSCLLLFTSPVYGCILVYFFFAHKWRRTRITSPMEYIEMRYGNPIRYLFTFVSIPLAFLSVGKLLFVLSIFISSALKLTGEYGILGFSLNGLEICILVTGIITVLYTAAGGIWAVVLTDTVQLIIVMVMSVILVPLSFMALGQGGLIEGVKQFVTSPPTQDYYQLFKPSQGFSFTLAWIFLFLLSFPGSDSVGQRLYSVPDEKAARKTIILSALLYAIAPVIWVFPVFVMRPLLTNMKELWPQLNNPNEASYVTITLMLLPNGMIGLVVSGILAATMSTISAVYNVISSIFIRDVYKPFFAPEAESRKLMAAGKVFTFVFGIITIWIGLLLANFGKIDAFTLTYTISTHAGFVFSAPIIAGLLFRRIPWWTPFVSIAACISTTMSLEFLFGGYLAREYPQGIFGEIKAHLYECKIFGAIAVNIIIFLICSRFYNDKDPRNQKADKLFSLLKKPIREDADAALFVPNLKTYRIVGWILAFYGIFMIALSTTGVTEDPRRINLVAGLIFMGLYGMIQWWTSPRFSPFPLVRKQLQKDIR